VSGRAHFLKTLGRSGWSLPDAWLEDGGSARLRRTAFPRRPRMAPGDRLVYYAAGWKRAIAVVEVVAEPTDADPLWPRWPWSVEVEPLLAVPLVSNAPPVEALGIPPRSMSQQSHIRLTPEHYARAVEALAGVAAD
jgi:hypothetical protein